MRMGDFPYVPGSTYRLQFNKEFTLKQAIAIVPYLKALGVDAIYCSPYYDSNSMHGYDVTDPNKLNPEIGSEFEFQEFCRLLKESQIGQILDVVPNHMGITGGKNQWWQDVLENGHFSQFASFFDIQWNPDKRELQEKILLCILPDTYGHVLENQEIKLVWKEGCLYIQFSDFYLPISFQSYIIFLDLGWEDFKKKNAEAKNEIASYEKILNLFRTIPITLEERTQKKEEGLKRLNGLLAKSTLLKKFFIAQLALFNGIKKNPASFNNLHNLLENQFYRLASWKVAAHEINYRRFFNIHELAAIRIEDESVLEAHHRWVFQLINEGKAQGIRIDHPDGLYDPILYFERLRKKFQVLTVVEKILEGKEELAENWDVEGTVGYDYLNVLNGIFIDQQSEKLFSEIYENFIHHPIDFEELLYEKKKLFAKVYMVSEINALGYLLDNITEKSRYYRDFTRQDLTKALEEIVAYFPVYRTYITPQGDVVSRRDADYIIHAVEKAKRKCFYMDESIFDFIKKVLLLKVKIKKEEAAEYREFVLRFQQLTGPIMAKGLEDTCFYIYHRFLSLNEVGGHPEHFGNSIEEFHSFNQKKLKKWPLGFLATSTHDTKRSEDVRQRLNVLSEMPDMWETLLKKWSRINLKLKEAHEGQFFPSENTEYFIYQTLIGIWPYPMDRKNWQQFCGRVWECVLKSLREAHVETNWTRPNLEYEACVRHFLDGLLDLESNNLFLKLFIPFQAHISRLGMWNSLSSIALKIASCGIVEIYQGTELFDYHLVDPDNRRPVNYSQRKTLLNAIQRGSLKMPKADYVRDLFLKSSEKIKLYLYWRGLQLRKKNLELFLEGDYKPLKVQGSKKNHLIAFIRKKGNKQLIVAAARFFHALVNQKQPTPLGEEVWGDTHILLPKELRNVILLNPFTDEEVRVTDQLYVAEIFTALPFAYLLTP